MSVGRSTKAILAVVLTVLTVAGTAAGTALQNDHRIDGLEWLGLIGAVLTGLVVWLTRNGIGGAGYWAKAIITVIGGVISTLTTSLAGNEGRSLGALFADLSLEQWLAIVLVPIVNGIVVAIAPNAAVSDDPPQPGGDPTPI